MESLKIIYIYIYIYQGLCLTIYSSTKSSPNLRPSPIMKVYKLRVWHKSKTQTWRETNL